VNGGFLKQKYYPENGLAMHEHWTIEPGEWSDNGCLTSSSGIVQHTDEMKKIMEMNILIWKQAVITAKSIN
jgi:hypothetical protein